MNFDTIDMPLPVTNKMLLENLIDEKSREIKKLREEISRLPKPLTDIEWGRYFLGCGNIQETYDVMVKLGFVIPTEEEEDE